MQNLLLDCKKILITFKISLLTLIMLVGAESIGIVVELGFTAFQHILFGVNSMCNSVNTVCKHQGPLLPNTHLVWG